MTTAHIQFDTDVLAALGSSRLTTRELVSRMSSISGGDVKKVQKALVRLERKGFVDSEYPDGRTPRVYWRKAL